MKLAKWLLLAACALVCCACSKSPLAYVEEDADFVTYFNTGASLDDNEWKALQRFLFDGSGDEVRNFHFMGTDLKEHKAQLAIWGRYKKDNGSLMNDPKYKKAVIVFEEPYAEKFIINAARGYSVTQEEIDDKQAFLLKHGDSVKHTLIMIDSNTVQIFWDKPGSVLKADNNSKLAGKIDKDVVYAKAKSSDSLREQAKIREKNYKDGQRNYLRDDDKKKQDVLHKELEFGDEIFSVYLDGSELRAETVTEADEIVD